MRYVILFALLSVVWGAAVEVPEECEWGESYWCSDLRIASKCGAVQHCMTTIWKNEKPQEDNTEVCTFCETVITDVRNFLEDQQEQKTIEQYLEAACTIIPSESLTAECKDLVANYLEIVLSLIASELDPQTVCSVMGLCQGFTDKVLHAQIELRPLLQSSAPKVEPICTDCKKFLQDMKEMLTSPAMEKELEQYIDDMLCTQLGSLADECKALVTEFVPTLLDLMTSEFDPAQICGSFGFCNGSFTPANILANLKLEKLKQRNGSGEKCAFCTGVFDLLSDLDKSKDLQADIQGFIKKHFCGNLGDLQSKCESSVDTYAPIMFELLVSELDPNTICKSLGACVTDQIQPERLLNKPLPKKDVKSSTTECVLCEFVMKQVDEMLGNNATQSEIIAALDKVCSLLPDTISQQCQDFVEEYGPTVFILLKAELSPELVCSTLGLCPSKRQEKVLLKATAANNEECGVCETVIQYMESLLEENATVQEVEAIADKVCNFLPTEMQQQCTDMIAQYAPSLIHYITQVADPNEICTLLGLCSNQTVMSKPLHVSLTRLMTAQKQQPNVMMHQQKRELLGAKNCTRGPGYWCKNMETAKECDMVDVCKTKYWGN